VPARDLADLAGFAPATLHGLGARVAAALTRRSADLVVTNVPGPQQPRYAAGSVLRHTYPVMPLPAGHSVAVGVTSYDGQVFHGITGDWDAVPDLDALAEAVPEALAELLEATG
jgi:diacylglycerol O-acyltransferase